jgi:Raf kinase inhibitor-like YbhB/YbcL family protein
VAPPALRGGIAVRWGALAFNAIGHPHWRGLASRIGPSGLALILEGIDSVKGVWSHWVVYDMPHEVDELPESVSPTFPRPGGGLEGRNDFGNVGYGEPCPSDGKAHRYIIRLYALDR